MLLISGEMNLILESEKSVFDNLCRFYLKYRTYDELLMKYSPPYSFKSDQITEPGIPYWY